MNVIKSCRIGSKCKAAQVAAWKYIRQNLLLLNIQQFESPSTFSSLLYFIEQQPAIRRNAKGFDRSVRSGTPQRWRDKYLIHSVGTIPYAYGRLFLSRRTLSEEVSIANLLKQVKGFDIEKFADAVLNALSVWDGIEISSR